MMVQEQMAYSALFALEDGASLLIAGVEQPVAIPVGHAILFKGYLFHAGNRYIEPNLRFFSYVASPQVEPALNRQVFLT